MNINPYTKWPDLKLEPLDFDFLLKAQAYQDQKADAASKTLDEAAGLLAALNPAPGNEKWASDISTQYNQAFEKVTNDLGKVPIQQTISDARRIKAHFLSNTDVKTILNNKEYYDKILAPYMANKEAQLNVPGGTMAGYLEPLPGGGYNFKQNKTAYAGSLSYQPYADFNTRYFNQLKEVVATVIPKDRNGNQVQTTTDEYGNKYWIDSKGVKTYVKDAATFKNAIDGLSNTILQQRAPEDRWYRADLEFRGQKDRFNKDDISKVLLELSKPLWGREEKGDTQIHQINERAAADGGSGTPSSVGAGVPFIEKGTFPFAIATEEERTQEAVAAKAGKYKGNDPAFVTEPFKRLQQTSITLKDYTPENLRITRTVDSKNDKVSYKIGVTEDEFVSKFPDANKQQARNEYRSMVMEYNRQGLEEQEQIQRYNQAIKNVNDKILGSNDPKAPGYNPNRKELEGFVNKVEKYNQLTGKEKQEFDLLVKQTIETMFDDAYENEKLDQGLGEEPFWQYEDEPQNAPSVKNKKENELAFSRGILTPAVKQRLYRDKSQDPRFKVLNNYAYDQESFAGGQSKKVQQEYEKLWAQSQLNEYKITSYDLPSTTDKDTPYLAKIQQAITKDLEGKLTVTDKGLKVWQKGSAIDNYVYYWVEPGASEGKMFSGSTLFKGSFAANHGVETQGLIYDRDSGFWWIGNLQSTDKDYEGTKVLIRPSNQEDFNKTILNNMSLNPGTAEAVSSVRAVLESMPYNNVGAGAVREVDPSDIKIQQVFENFGMQEVYISGNDQSGYDLTYRSRIPGVPVNPETGMHDTEHFNSIIDLSSAINKHGQLYNQYSGKK